MSNTKSVNITGCGYIGKLLALQLLGKNQVVTALVSSEKSLAECKNKGIPSERVDLDETLVDSNPSNQRLIYLVPPPPTGRTDSRIHHYLQAIEKQPPEKFVLISTTGVYGDCQGEWIDESTPLNPTADRAYRRADAERQVQQFCQRHNTPLVILRVAGIYGPGKIPLARIKSGLPIVNQQDSPYTNRIHAFDLVSICEKAIVDQNITGIYNVTDGNPGTMYDYFTGVAATLKLPTPPSITLDEAQQQLSAGMLSYMAESRRIDNKKLLRDFQLKLQFPKLQDGLKRII